MVVVPARALARRLFGSPFKARLHATVAIVLYWLPSV